MRVKLIVLFLLGSVICYAQPDIFFTKTPANENDIAIEIGFSWASNTLNTDFRYKLEMPMEASSNKNFPWVEWSAWSNSTNTGFNNLIDEGKYVIHVEARNKTTSQTKNISHEFYIKFLMPDFRNVDVKINWNEVNSFSSFEEKKNVLAREYYLAYKEWIEIYEKNRRKLRVYYEGKELLKDFKNILSKKNDQYLYLMAEQKKTISIKNVCSPKEFYDIVKVVGLKFVKLYRDDDTKQAILNLLSAYWACNSYPLLEIDNWAEISIPFKTSILRYTEKEKLDKYVTLDCGEGYRIADWNDILMYEYVIEQVVQSFVSDATFDKLFITYNNDHFYDYRQHYFINFNNNGSNFLSHEKIGNKQYTLASWFEMEEHMLCIKKE